MLKKQLLKIALRIMFLLGTKASQAQWSAEGPYRYVNDESVTALAIEGNCARANNTVSKQARG